MSSEWTSRKIGEIFELVNGYAFKSGDFISSGIPVLKIKNVKPNNVVLDDLSYVSEEDASRRSDKAIRRGDILISMSGNRFDGSKDTWVGKVAHFDISGHYMLNQRVGVLRPREGVVIDRKCAAYFLSSDDYQKLFISIATSSGGQANLSPAQILGEQLHLPPIKEQIRISELLGGLDDRITLLRETNATLEAIAQALFKSWFVDFDPVRAKAEGRARQDGERSGQPRMPQASDLPRPGAEAGAEAQGQPEGMDATTAALFPDSFEESELGLVPKGWQRLAFTETVNVIGGGTPKTSVPEYWDGDIPWFSVVDAPAVSDVFVIDTVKHISVAGLNGSSTKLLPEGTTIISARGTVGRLALVGKDMAMNQSCYGLQGKAGDAYFTYFSTYRLVENLKQRSHGSVFDTITTETMKGVQVIYPDANVIEAFEALLRPFMCRIKENLQQAQTLTQLRDTLLPRLISGQLRLPEAEILVTESME